MSPRWVEDSYDTAAHWCGRAAPGETRGAVAVSLLDSTGTRVMRDRRGLLLGSRVAALSEAGIRLDNYKESVRSDAAGLVWMCDRESPEATTHIDGPDLGGPRYPLGYVPSRSFLVSHLRLGHDVR